MSSLALGNCDAHFSLFSDFIKKIWIKLVVYKTTDYTIMKTAINNVVNTQYELIRAHKRQSI